MNTMPVLVFVGTAVALGAATLSGVSAHELREEVERLEVRLQSAESREAVDPVPAVDPLVRVHETLEALELRLARLEARPRRELVQAAETGTAPKAAVVEPSVAREAALPAEDDGQRAEMEALLELLADGFDWSGDADQLQRFYELARETDLIDEKIAELEAEVAANPGDLEGRMHLADTYVAKLMTIQGPEQGLWGTKAENEWRAVVGLDENHWKSTFSLGNNYAYYPDVMGKTDDSIAYLERARTIQERSTQGDEHVQTYLSLARMYQRKGQAEQARRVLEAGLRYHPGNTSLEAALTSLD